MKVLLFLVAMSSILGVPLTKQENEELQRTCGVTYQKGRYRRSMNTKMATRYAAPFTVLIHISLKDGTPKERLSDSLGLCTGTIISPRHILTAAHCFGEYDCMDDGTPYVFVQGKTKKFYQKLDYLFVSTPTKCQNKALHCDTTLDSLIVKPKKAFISQEYVDKSCGFETKMRGDIAIIELEEDIPLTKIVQPACLHTERIPENTLLTIYGYGNTGEGNANTSGIMRKHESTTDSKEVCSKSSQKNPPQMRLDTTIHSDEICSRNEQETACSGDSGSGLILAKDNLSYVTAVTSWGPRCKLDILKNLPYRAEVSSGLYHHLDWICVATGICPKGYPTADEKSRLIKKCVRMDLSEDFELIEIEK